MYEIIYQPAIWVAASEFNKGHNVRMWEVIFKIYKYRCGEHFCKLIWITSSKDKDFSAEFFIHIKPIIIPGIIILQNS